MSAVLADALDVWGFERNTIVFTDGSLGFGFCLTPVDISCFDDDRINAFTLSLARFLNGLPVGIDLQFIQDIGAGNAATLEEHALLGRSSNNLMAKSLCEERKARFLALEAEGELAMHSLYAFVRRPLSEELVKKPTLFSRTTRFLPIAEDTLAREIAELDRVKIALYQNFKQLNLEPVELSSDEIIRLMYEQWNPNRPLPLGNYDPDDIRNSILYSDAAIRDDGFVIGRTHHRVLSLKMRPDETFASMASVLRELPFGSRVFLSIHVPDQQKQIAALQAQRRLAFSMAHGKQTGVADLESEAKLTDVESLLAQMISQGERVFQASINIVLKAQDRHALDAQASQALMKFRELGSAEGMEESLAAFDIFCELALPNARAAERSMPMQTSNLCDFLPVYGPWAGHKKGHILLRSRMGSLVGLDPFSQDLTNYNHVISGGSGSGKSFLTNILLLQTLKEDPRVFIVDIGGSYKKLCENLSGQNIPLGVDSDLAINPFDLNAGETVPSPQKIKFLLSLIELMTKEEDESRLRRLDRAELEEAIQVTYDRYQTPRLTDLRAVLLEHESPEIKRFGRILSTWCGSSAFGKLIDRPTTVKLQKPIVAFDLKGMETYPELQAVALFIITDFVWREVQRDRHSKKLLVFDECWKLLETDSGAGFIAEVFRTFRKYYASAIAISQNIDDFAKSKVATAILSNSSIKWLLMQKGADPNRLREALLLNERELDLVASLTQERGRYSEAFLMAESERCVVAIESTPLEYWIATTDPRDLAEIDKASKANPQWTNLEVLTQLSSRYPLGVAAQN